MKRHKRMRRKSVMPRAKIKALLDKKHSLLIRALYGNKCVVCGSTDRVGCGHLFSRSHEAARWDTDRLGNCHPQCWPCNFKHEYDPQPFNKWYIDQNGIEAWEALHRRWEGETPYRSRVALEAKLKEIEGMLERPLSVFLRMLKTRPGNKGAETLRPIGAAMNSPEYAGQPTVAGSHVPRGKKVSRIDFEKHND